MQVVIKTEDFLSEEQDNYFLKVDGQTNCCLSQALRNMFPGEFINVGGETVWIGNPRKKQRIFKFECEPSKFRQLAQNVKDGQDVEFFLELKEQT